MPKSDGSVCLANEGKHSEMERSTGGAFVSRVDHAIAMLSLPSCRFGMALFVALVFEWSLICSRLAACTRAEHNLLFPFFFLSSPQQTCSEGIKAY